MRPAGFPWRIILLGTGVVLVAEAGVSQGIAETIAWVAAGVALILAFLHFDARAGRGGRMLPLGSLDWRKPSGQVISMVLFLSAATTGLITYGPLLMTQIHGMSPFETGIVLLLESVGWSVVAVIAAGIPDRYEKQMIAAGFTLAMSGVALLAIIMASGPAYAITFGSVMMGAGFGLAFVSMIRRATRLVDESDRERVASAIPTTQRLGYALGAAFTGMIANASGFGETASLETARQAAHAIFTIALVPAVIGLAATALFVGRRARA